MFSKNSLLLQSQGVSLSIADAKVDTFNLTTKQTSKFFRDIFKEILQMADLQERQRDDSPRRQKEFWHIQVAKHDTERTEATFRYQQNTTAE